jgi:hypothetical protein
MEKAEEYLPEVDFVSFILMLSSSAWVSLGKIQDPSSGEVQKDLKGAKYCIDVLIMLREKTRGNLDEEEEKALNGIISDLQVNYAETFFSAESGVSSPGESNKESSGDTQESKDAAGSNKKNQDAK